MKKQYLKAKPVCKVTFSLPKEAVIEAQSVQLVGEFNDWQASEDYLLQPTKDGSYSLDLELNTGREYEFRYLIDNEKWENDWTADKYVPSPFQGIENSVVSLAEAVKEAKSNGNGKTKKAPTKKASKKKGPKLDDLKIVEGIGPKIAGLMAEAGIDTWAKLAKAELDSLKEVLVKAGARYKMHDPTTWPQQAKLALEEKWEQLKTLQNELKGGKKA